MQNISVYRPDTRMLSALESLNLTTWISESLEHGSCYLLIDFSRVSFMDSLGLGALLIAHNRVEKAGGHLGFYGISGQARMLLELTNMDNIFHLYESREDFLHAVDTLRSISSTSSAA